MTNRKLQALRNLAERPGTPAEGVLAREILERFDGDRNSGNAELERPLWIAWDDYMRGSVSMDEFLESIRSRVMWERSQPLPTEWTCACGETVMVPSKCSGSRHEAIHREIPSKFPKGLRVYYNCWAYSINSPATVSGYSREWNWIRLKFDDLKTVRGVPIYKKGWRITREPVEREQAERLRHTV